MASQLRLQKIAELIKREISQAINKKFDIPSDVFITVGEVVVSEDLKQAKTPLSIYPTKVASAIFRKLNRQIYPLQQVLNRHLKIHPVPKIIFILDEALEKQAQIERIFAQTKK